MLELLKNINVITENGQLNKQARVLLNKNPNVLKMLLEKTSFLPEDENVITRIHCLLQNITAVPNCLTCGKPVTFNRVKKKYNRFCQNNGGSCANKHKEVKNKYKETNLTKYGVENPSQNKEVVKKRIQTNIERFGGHAPASSKEVREKSEKTNLNRYGVKNPTQYEKVKEKIKQANIKKYGTSTYAESQINPDALKKLNDIEWLTENYIYRNKSIKAIAKELSVGYNTVKKYINKFNLTNDNHPKIIEGSPVDWKSLLFDKEWLEEQYLHRNIPKTYIAKELKISPSYVHKICKRFEIPENKNTYKLKSSSQEREIASFIKTLIPKSEILTNTKDIIPPQEIDIYIPEYKLAIEYNGIFWHSELNGKDKKYHLDKLLKCQANGIHLIQIWSSEWTMHEDIVKSRISSLLNKNKRIYARQCEVIEISSKESRAFLEKNHLQGFVGAQTHLALTYHQTIVAVMTFGSGRFNKTQTTELLRYSNALFTNVIGGANKLFKYYVKHYNPETIISYSDKRWNKGELYKILGFEYTHTSTPNYKYFDVFGNIEMLYSRNMFQKHKLAKLLKEFDENISEWHNMINNGYDRIWDCGNDVFVWSK